MDLWRVGNVCIMNGVSVRFQKGMRIVGVMDEHILALSFYFTWLVLLFSVN
jgi:hypothetical protein